MKKGVYQDSEKDKVSKREIILFIVILVIGLVVYFLLFAKPRDTSQVQVTVEQQRPQPASDEPAQQEFQDLALFKGIKAGNLYLHLELRPEFNQPSMLYRFDIDTDADGVADYFVHVKRNPPIGFGDNSGFLDSQGIETSIKVDGVDVQLPLMKIGSPQVVEVGYSIFDGSQLAIRTDPPYASEMSSEELRDVVESVRSPSNTLQAFRAVVGKNLYLRLDLPDSYLGIETTYVFDIDSDRDGTTDYSVSTNSDFDVGFMDTVRGLDGSRIRSFFYGNSVELKVPLDLINSQKPVVRVAIFSNGQQVGNIESGDVKDIYFEPETSSERVKQWLGFFNLLNKDCSQEDIDYLYVSTKKDFLYLKLKMCAEVRPEFDYKFYFDTTGDKVYDHHLLVQDMDVKGDFLPEGTIVGLPPDATVEISADGSLEMRVPMTVLGEPSLVNVQLIVEERVDDQYVMRGMVNYDD